MVKIRNFFIEITNVCNMNCLFCPNDLMKREKGFMSKDMFFKIVDEISSKGIAKDVCFHIMGDPLLHRDILTFLDYAKRANLGINLLTNGILLDKYGDDLLKRNINIDISYQTPDCKSFLLRRAPNNITFDKYKEIIFNFIEKKFALQSSSRITLHLMNTKHEKPRGGDVCSNERIAKNFLYDIKNKVNRIKKYYDISQVESNSLEDNVNNARYCWDSSKKINSDNINILSNDNLKKGIGDSLYIEVLPSISVLFKYASDWPSIFENKKYKIKRGTCIPAFKWDFFGIFWNGDTTFCCLDYEGFLNLGNVAKESIEDIYNSDNFKKIREEMPKGNLVLHGCQLCRGAKTLPEYFLRKLYYYYQIKKYIK